jgi:hypothetical protein
MVLKVYFQVYLAGEKSNPMDIIRKVTECHNCTFLFFDVDNDEARCTETSEVIGFMEDGSMFDGISEKCPLIGKRLIIDFT